jgi:VWFA-related protein
MMTESHSCFRRGLAMLFWTFASPVERPVSWVRPLRSLVPLGALATILLVPAPASRVQAQASGVGQTAAQRPPPGGQPSGQQPSAPPSPAPPAGDQKPPAQQPPAGQTAGAQSQQPAPPPPFRTGIDFVRVDVLVTDRQGNALKGLTQADFEVYEDDKPQKVESFRFIEVSGNPVEGELPRQIRTTHDEETELARDDVRLFVIFFDDYHVRRGSALAVKEPLTRFIRTQLGPMDVVALMYPLTAFSEIGFTRSHDAMVREIARFDGRKHDYTPRNQFEERYAYYPAETVERIRNQVSLSALESLVQGLGSLREGRKSVILVSEGYSNYLPPQLRDPVASMPGYGNPNRRRGRAGERTPDEQLLEERAAFMQNTDLLTDLREVFTAANRANVAIYALDPRGLAAFEYDIDQGVGLQRDKAGLDQGLNTLRTLADETDGRAIINSNDLQTGLKQMVKDASSYYLLGYTTASPTDGKFHEIKVRVKRPGVQIRARKGYWALKQEDVTAAAAIAARPAPDPKVTQALSAIQTPLRARVIRTWIGTSRGDEGKTAVTLVWEPVPNANNATNAAPARVTVTAAGAGGSVFRGKVPQTGEGAATNGGSAPAAAAPGGRVTFQAPPGSLQLKLSVEGTAGQVIDSDFQDLVVPDYTKPEPLLSVPAVFRARTQRDINSMAGNADATPTTGREFSRTERLLIRFQAYAPGGGTASPAARLLNRGGTKMADVPVKSVAIGDGAFEANLPLASLPPGDFLVEVSLSSDGRETKQLVAFRVTS